DCLMDDVIYFPLSFTDFSGDTLEVWATSGTTNCADDATRGQAANPCWKVAHEDPTSANMGAPLGIRVQDMLFMMRDSENLGTAAVCTPPSASSAVQSLTLYFVLVNSNTTAAQAQWSTKFDLVGPAAPTSLSLGIGDTLLKVNWAPNADTDVLRYQFYCDP